MKKSDLFSGIVLFVFGMTMFLWSIKYPFGEIHAPGAGFLPFLASLVLVVLSLMIAIPSLQKAGGSSGHAFFTRPEAPRRVLTVIGAFLAYRLLFPAIGFTPTNFIFFLLITRLLGYHSWKISLLFSFVTTTVTYLVFQVWLQVQLPDPIWGY